MPTPTDQLLSRLQTLHQAMVQHPVTVDAVHDAGRRATLQQAYDALDAEAALLRHELDAREVTSVDDLLVKARYVELVADGDTGDLARDAIRTLVAGVSRFAGAMPYPATAG